MGAKAIAGKMPDLAGDFSARAGTGESCPKGSGLEAGKTGAAQIAAFQC